MGSSGLTDQHGRRFSYLRLSVIDACNFKCVYCLPNGYKKPAGAKAPLSVNEIANLVGAFSELGLWKVRLTGGEPTLRRDIHEIISAIRETPGIRKIALSTNAHDLKRTAGAYLASGVTAVNVSVDSLDRKVFHDMTGVDRLPDVLEGIEKAIEVGFENVKVNAVLMGGLNDEHLSQFLAWIRERPISVRFIELMPTGTNQDLFRKHHMKSAVFRKQLLDAGWAPRVRAIADGPAEEFLHPDYKGRFGIIAPYGQDFCANCNRLRVTSQGLLRLCLFGEGGHNLRDLLQEPSQREELIAHVRQIMKIKDPSHYLTEGRFGDNTTFSSMGG